MRVTPTQRRLVWLRSSRGRAEALFFDIDGTIFVKQLLIELMLAIAGRFRSKRRLVAPLKEALRLYRCQRTYDYEPVIKAAVDVVSAFFLGLPRASVIAIAKRVVERHGGETYLFPRTVLACYSKIPLCDRGPIVAITGAPQEIAEIFCQRLGFDLVYGVTYESVNGRYTGIRDESSVVDKGGILDKVVVALDLDLRKCYAFGDTSSDLPMFQRVRMGFAINPNPRLLRAIPNSPSSRSIIWVDDHQKNGVAYFSWLSMNFVQCHQMDILPRILSSCMPLLPGAPCVECGDR